MENTYDLMIQQMEQQQSVALSIEGSDSKEVSGVQTYPWVTPPPGFQAFDFQGQIDTPLVGSGDTIVLEFRMPRGWDGVIKKISHNYNGSGFTPGGGGLIWRIFADRRPIKNYSNILFEFGSLVSPRDTFGIMIQENQLIDYVVNVAGGGGFVPSQSTQVIVTMAGWMWPKM